MSGLPKYTELFSAVLQVLQEHPEGLRRPQVKEQVAKLALLSASQMREPMPSGRGLLYESRIGWAMSYLKYAGLAETPTRGTWRLTEDGIRLSNRFPKGLTGSEIDRIVSNVRTAYYEERGQREGETPASELPTEVSDSGKGPEELIEEAVKIVEVRVVAELLSEVTRITDRKFELLVLDVLEAMGYAWASAGVKHTGRSGDGGIDGIINMDPLGIQKIYVQAKKWTGSVGPKEIHAFVGSLEGFKAAIGVFITSSDFTKAAREYGDKMASRVVLIDGKRLARLMIQHSVGVSHGEVKLPKLDGDYFEET